MRGFIKFISWGMLAVGLIAGIDLIVGANNGATGNGPGIFISIVWVIQSTATLLYAYEIKFED